MLAINLPLDLQTPLAELEIPTINSDSFLSPHMTTAVNCFFKKKKPTTNTPRKTTLACINFQEFCISTNLLEALCAQPTLELACLVKKICKRGKEEMENGFLY